MSSPNPFEDTYNDCTLDDIKAEQDKLDKEIAKMPNMPELESDGSAPLTTDSEKESET
jgi:hypothetical protein